MKKGIIGFILGALIFGGVSSVLAYNYVANQIRFTPKDTTWEVDNVKDALDDIQSIYSNRLAQLETSNIDKENIISDLQSTISTKDSIIADLQNQLNNKTFDIKLVGTYQLDSSHNSSVNQYTKTFDLSDYDNYQNMQISDFYVIIEGMTLAKGSGSSDTNWHDIEKNYNSNTGILTISVPYICYSGYGVWIKGSVYLIK